MKYTRLSTHTTPSSVQDWLEEELENRGIDGVIYTRYILSVLQDDEDEDDEEEEEEAEDENGSEKRMEEEGVVVSVGSEDSFAIDLQHGQALKPSVSSFEKSVPQKRLSSQYKANNNNIYKKPSNKYLHKRYQQSRNSSSWKYAQQQNSSKWSDASFQDCTRLMNIEQKRSVVVECLRSASEEDFEVESLVDELCAKLREHKYNKMGHSQGISSNATKSDAMTTENFNETAATTDSISNNESKISNASNTSLKEQARRYYAAFPALSTNALKSSNEISTTASSNAVVSSTAVSSDSEKANILKQFRKDVFSSSSTRTMIPSSLSENLRKENERNENNWDTEFIEHNLKKEEEANEKKSFNLMSDYLKNEISDENSFNNFNFTGSYYANISLNGNEHDNGILNENETQSSFISEKVRETEDLFTSIGGKECEVTSLGNILNNKMLRKNDEDEKFKMLIAKFNSSIASLWNDQKVNYYNKESIWCFDKNSSSSPLSDDTLSPNNNTDEQAASANSISSIWNSFKNDNSYFTLSKITDPSAHWDSIMKPSVKDEMNFADEENNNNNNSWAAINRMSSNNLSKKEENNTTLSNHGGDSLFVEVKPSRTRNVMSKYISSTVYTNDSFQQQQQQLQNFGYLPSSCSNSEMNETNESLLTSSKTHFQPIKQESLDDELDALDSEVSSLVPCSGKCPNKVAVGSKKSVSRVSPNNECKHRSLSTSLSELSSIMGPFIENDLDNTEYSPEMDENSISVSDLQATSEQIQQSSNDAREENEFDELCSMLNSATVWNWSDDLPAFTSDKEISNQSWSFYKNPVDDEINTHLYKNDFINASSEQQMSFDISSCDADRENIADNDGISAKANEYQEIETNREYIFDGGLSTLFPSHTGDEMPSSAGIEAYKSSIEWSTGEVYDLYDNNDGASGDCSDPSQVYYSWNLEKEWQEEESIETSSTSLAKREFDMRRPCSFFLEGNCRRSDCKFSHDLSNITCKFWEESSCFKGVLCPFLHGYPSATYCGNPEDEDNGKEYIIESEADFPALTTGEALPMDSEKSDCFSNVIGKSKVKPEKQESNVLFRIVKKKQKKGGQRNSNEKAV